MDLANLHVLKVVTFAYKPTLMSVSNALMVTCSPKSVHALQTSLAMTTNHASFAHQTGQSSTEHVKFVMSMETVFNVLPETCSSVVCVKTDFSSTTLPVLLVNLHV